MSRNISKYKFSKTICNLNPIFCCIILSALILGISALLDLDMTMRFSSTSKASQSVGYWLITNNDNGDIVTLLSKLGMFAFIFLGLGLISTIIILIANRKTIKSQRWLLLFSTFGMILIIFITISAGLTYIKFVNETYQSIILTIWRIHGEDREPSYTTVGYIYLCICIVTILVETIFGFMFMLKTYFMTK